MQILELMRTGRLQTVVGDNVEWDQLPQALARMAARETTGRLVVTTGAHD
ncbi:zinc-binding dehydrogenase [Mycolicibacterium peregrinum]|uniref:Uncharacterized protein n=1 Tax=Mycolicibacterium peregrinum TaxID=43304 RepID=A0A4Z0HI35_MYCPR|nr:zinc-binding dehydrogenase [Mycolicibacterium peregrinum]TGB35986.1 hypothetical protein EJD94_30230 [Mycolicibacterium peregrinum]TGB42680.1 hypothetical protein EJD98_12550 [Mycolicibacterium peregrinum]